MNKAECAARVMPPRAVYRVSLYCPADDGAMIVMVDATTRAVLDSRFVPFLPEGEVQP